MEILCIIAGQKVIRRGESHRPPQQPPSLKGFTWRLFRYRPVRSFSSTLTVSPVLRETFATPEIE